MLRQMPDKDVSQTIDMIFEIRCSNYLRERSLQDVDSLAELALGQGLNGHPDLFEGLGALSERLRDPLEEELGIHCIISIDEVHQQVCSVICSI